MRQPQVFAFSGMLRSAGDELSDADLTDHAISLAGVEQPRLCYLPTAVGDAAEAVAAKTADFAARRPDVLFSVLTLFTQPSVPDVRRHLLDQDVLLVEGGSVVNLLAVWRAHGLDEVMRECWAAGVVLSGASAGSLCWHLGGPTDSYRDALDPCLDGLGLLPYSNGVHDDFADQPRRATYRRLVAAGELPAGYASEDGVGLHYVGTRLREAVSVRRGSRAWWVEPEGDGGHVERPVETRYLGP
jgi:peptidase E